jgi:hypothetical protein
MEEGISVTVGDNGLASSPLADGVRVFLPKRQTNNKQNYLSMA